MTEPNAVNAATLLNDDVAYVGDLPARDPRSATEMRLLIGAAVEFHSRFQGLDSENTYVHERDDGTLAGKIGVTHTHDAAFKAVKQFINGIPGGRVTGDSKAFGKAGTHGVRYEIEPPEEETVDAGDEDEGSEPAEDRLELGDEVEIEVDGKTFTAAVTDFDRRGDALLDIDAPDAEDSLYPVTNKPITLVSTRAQEVA